MDILFERITDAIDLPTIAHEGDAGIDLRSAVDVDVAPGEIVRVPVGIKVQLPANSLAFVLPRSGLSSQGLSVIPGTIDSGYRGEISAIVHNVSQEIKHIKKAERICQFVALNKPQLNIHYGTVQENTERGQNGFGSTGKE